MTINTDHISILLLEKETSCYSSNNKKISNLLLGFYPFSFLIKMKYKYKWNIAGFCDKRNCHDTGLWLSISRRLEALCLWL